MENFKDLELPKLLASSLERLKFVTPTPIQAQAIPLALEGKDVLGTAQTGTGKTLAFSIPLIANLLNNKDKTALIVVPTRELAQQVHDNIQKLLSRESFMPMALLIGGDSFDKQFRQLRAKPRVVVGTPGRIIDHMNRKTLFVKNINFLVLDEMDRMFDMGFSIQLEEIIEALPTERQTLMFSATLPKNIEKLAAKYLNNAERVSVGSLSMPSTQIKQEMFKVSESEKYEKLVEEINKLDDKASIIIFVKTKSSADELADELRFSEGFKAAAIHGDLRQHKRQRVISAFRKGAHQILVATDVASRGIDIPAIQLVINYDLPQDKEDYIHRIGRTGRNGADGAAISLVSRQDERKWKDIHRFMYPEQYANQNEKSERSSDGRGRRDGAKRRGDRFNRSERRGGGERRDERRGDRRDRDDRRDGRREGGSQSSGGRNDNFKKPRNKGGFGGRRKVANQD